MNKPPATLPDEKKKIILQATIREFAEKGYEKASTNSIVREAGISKGLLFHYFGSKKNLYLYALDACIDHYLKYFSGHLKTLPPDLLDRILETSRVKMKMFIETPLMYRVVASAFVDAPRELKEEIMERQNRIYSEYLPLFLKDIDKSLFRNDISHDKAIELIMAAMETLSQKYISIYRESADRGLREMPDYLEDLKEYISILKYGIYKRAGEKGAGLNGHD